jgi:hypothetical protein
MHPVDDFEVGGSLEAGFVQNSFWNKSTLKW